MHRERLLIAANRVGKTELGAFEVTCHLTGQYPHWWTGRVFAEPVTAWACGDTAKTTRDIVQAKLLGPPGRPEDGMITSHLVERTAMKQGVADAIESAWVRHATGGLSLLQLKSYDQRREAYQGTSTHVVWLDEECPEDIYVESLLRTAETSTFPGGILLLTFTHCRGSRRSF